MARCRAAAGPVESAVYFAVAECLANVGKHSGATTAWIEARHADGVLRVGSSATTGAAVPTRAPGRACGG